MKVDSNFQTKDKTKIGHKHDLAYQFKGPECYDNCISEIHMKLYDRICDHSGKDSKYTYIDIYLCVCIYIYIYIYISGANTEKYGHTGFFRSEKEMF